MQYDMLLKYIYCYIQILNPLHKLSMQDIRIFNVPLIFHIYVPLSGLREQFVSDVLIHLNIKEGVFYCYFLYLH